MVPVLRITGERQHLIKKCISPYGSFYALNYNYFPPKLSSDVMYDAGKTYKQLWQAADAGCLLKTHSYVA